MTAIPRSVLKSFRSVARRLFGRARNDSIWLSVVATTDTLVLRAVWYDAALEHRVQDQFKPAAFAVRLEQLADCEAKSPELVSFEPSAEGVTIQWLHRGIPQQAFCPRPPQELPSHPEKPKKVWTTEAGLLRALADATDVTDPLSSRYALGCLCLRGESGSIVATDGRHLLVQRGYELPWQGDLLVQSSPVFRAPELAADGPITIGATDSHVAIGSASWTAWLPIDKEGRFPTVDGNIRPEAAAIGRLSVAKADAEFLLPRLDNLPGAGDTDGPITLDLNGRVTLRAWGEDQPRPLELLLSNSSAGGEPASVCMNRHYLARALRLGFEQFLFFGPEVALQGHDDRRTYIWMPVEGQEAPRGATDPVRVESPVETPVETTAATTQVSIHRPRTKEKKVTQTAPAEAGVPATATKPRKRSSSTTAKTPFEQAIALRDTLQAAAKLANELAREFKHQHRQARIVETTLASLKQLQKAAG